ncbi:MAG TPA: IS1634 family transposase [Firmicutes bacterium]|nr:IS1634 family transposase [Bacillota bacterium]
MAPSLKIFHAGPAPLISALFDALGIGKTLDSVLAWDQTQCKLPPSIRIKALVINILAGKTPLYNVERFFKFQDTENLLGQGVTCEDLNDDCLARALDMLVEANPKKVTSTIMLTALAIEDIVLNRIHADTTSISVYGEYQHDEEEEDSSPFIRLLRGHSKDHRPDLLQLKVGLGVTQDGIPVIGEPLSGNVDDKRWNNDFIKTMAAHLDRIDLTKVIYVADSSVVTKDNLDEIAKQGLLMISRFPATFTLEGELKELAWEKNEWVEVGKLCSARDGAAYRKAASYKVQAFTRELYGRLYNFVVVYSTALDKRKVKALDRRIEELHKDLTTAAKEVQAKEFACKPDASVALEEFLAKHANDFYPMSAEVIEETRPKKRAKKGRPKKDEVVELETVYRIRPVMGALSESAVKGARERNNCFVLITNDLLMEPADVLREYKEQIGVETSFKFLKDPTYLDAIYLKKESRIEALAYVLLMALLIHRILQRRVRKALETEGSHIVVAGGVKTTAPTGNRILELLAPYQVLCAKEGDREYRVIQEIPNEEPLERILRLAGFTQDIYVVVRPSPYQRE